MRYFTSSFKQWNKFFSSNASDNLNSSKYQHSLLLKIRYFKLSYPQLRICWSNIGVSWFHEWVACHQNKANQQTLFKKLNDSDDLGFCDLSWSQTKHIISEQLFQKEKLQKILFWRYQKCRKEEHFARAPQPKTCCRKIMLFPMA